MSLLTKIGVGLIAGFLLIVTLKEWIIVPIAIILIFLLVRLIADLFWWGRDDGKW